MFSVLAWLIVGFVVGLLARWVSGGGGPRGFFMTSFFGIAGSVAGGAIAREFGLPQSGLGGLLMSVIGAVVLLAVVGFLTKLFRK